MHASHHRRLNRDRSRKIVVPEAGAEIVIRQGVDQVVRKRRAGYRREVHRASHRGGQFSTGDGRIPAFGRGGIVDHPVRERPAQGPHRFGGGIGIVRQGTGATGGSRLDGLEPTPATPMRHTGKIISANVRRQGNVRLSVGADDTGRHPQPPEFGRPKRFHDFGAGSSRAATVQQTRSGAAADVVPIGAPPQYALAPGLEQTCRAAGNRKPEVQRILPCRDIGVRAVPDDALRLVLIETQVDESLDEIARLRRPKSNRSFHQSGDRIRRAVVARCRSNEGTTRGRAWQPDRCRAREGPWPCRPPDRAGPDRSRPSGRSA